MGGMMESNNTAPLLELRQVNKLFNLQSGTVTALDHLFTSHGLSLQHVERIQIGRASCRERV